MKTHSLLRRWLRCLCQKGRQIERHLALRFNYVNYITGFCEYRLIVAVKETYFFKAMVYSKRTLFYYFTCIEHRELKLSELINLPHSIAVIVF